MFRMLSCARGKAQRLKCQTKCSQFAVGAPLRAVASVGPDGFDFIFQSDKGLPTSLLSLSLPPRTAPYPLNHRSMRFEEGDPRRKETHSTQA